MRTKQLGLLISPRAPTDKGVIRGVIRYVQNHGGWEIATQYAVPSLPWNSLHAWKGDGLIAMVYNEEQYRALVDKRLPTVNASSRVHTPKLPAVFSDNPGLARAAAEHLLSLGLRRFAAIGRRWLYHDPLRLEGFVQAVCQCGFPCVRIDLTGKPRAVHERPHMQTLMRLLPRLQKPVGIFTAHDELGCLVLRACRQLDLKVPYDVAVIGVNNNDLLCETAQPPLTSICQQAERIGYEAARLLDRGVVPSGDRVEPLQIAAGELVERRSTDFLAIDDQDVIAALVFIRDHVNKAHNVDDVLDHVCVSRRTLDKKFCAVLGHPLSEEIRCLRIRRAQDLLAKTQEQILNVALRSGFESPSGFYRAFRKHTGLTPREYRRQFGQIG